MPEMLSIEVLPRTLTGKKVKTLRQQGVVPGVIYGHGVSLQPVQVGERELTRFLARISASSLINVQVAGESLPRLAIIREIQRDVLTQKVTHFDFLQVSLSERMRAAVPIVLVGTSPAVTDGQGVLLQGLSSLEVECLPTELPEEIRADISGLVSVDDQITVADLVIADGIAVHTPPDHMVARVIAEKAIAEEEVEALPELPEEQEVEVITERKAKERRERAEQEEKG